MYIIAFENLVAMEEWAIQAHFFINVLEARAMGLPDERDALVLLKEKELELWEMIEELIESIGYRLVDLEVSGGGRGRTVVRIYLGSNDDTGVSLKACETVSKEVSALFDVKDPIRGRYTLEVSSPGLTRPLKRRSHFEEEVGSSIEVVLSSQIDGKRKIVGILQRVFEKQGHIFVVIESDGNEYEIPLSQMSRARKHFEM